MGWSAAAGLLLLAPLLAGCLLPDAGNGGDGSDDGSGSDSTTSRSSSRAPGQTGPGGSGGPGGIGGNGSSAGAGGDLGNGTGNVTGEPRVWPLPAAATIRPGASIEGGSCTANFVFTSLDNSTVYLGTAAHCFSDDGATQTDGCLAAVQELGAKRDIQGASKSATLVYSSWSAMQARNEGGDVCRNNDFALLRLEPEDAGKVSPALRQFGGPTGLASARDVGMSDKVLSYGNSGTRPEDSLLSPREGFVTLPAGGCDARVVFPNAAIPGDSGSPVILGDGRAMGVFVSIELLPIPGQGHVCMLEDLMGYAAYAGMEVQLATWEQLDEGILPA